ncbi:MAG: Uma2 family endonuclease [Planctomycetales bacterium]|nr:Uma2 family endonuclease [Planctomycetales bacterium]
MASVSIEDRVVIPRDIQSLADFRRWAGSPEFPDTGRIDYIAGQIEVDMQAEEVHGHGGVKVAIVGAIFMLNEEFDLGELSTDQTRIIAPAADLSCEPDVVFIRHETITAGDVRFVPKAGSQDRYIEIEGGPDLVVEIISDSSVGKDRRRLPPAYFAAGVREYWLADARGERMDFQIHCRGDSQFEPVAVDDEGLQPSAVLGCRFRLERERNRHGHWKYSLESKRS